MRLGFGEIVVVLALALLFFGPSKLPQLGSSLGQAIKSFKKGLSSIQEDDSAASEQEAKQLPARPEEGAPAASDQVAARGTKR
ncbi:MAG TPA: twin-arginine translocase TatA/TatE family subunit [Myxococcales bacterium]|nr:twin-arginine translocase TatA/TatE family subunit [Myxococcales bacterium]